MQNVHIGPLPPPIGGGISVYLYRLSKIEKNSLFINSRQIIGTRYFKIWLIKELFDFKKKNFILHIQSLQARLLFYFLSYFSIHKFSLVIHGYPLFVQYKEANFFTKFLIRGMLNRAKFIQVVNPEFKELLQEFKIKNKNIIVKNAFLPPPLEEEALIFKTYNKKLIEFINNKKPIIISMAHFLNFYNNEDLYGLDMCIELTYLLRKDYPDIGFLFAISDITKNYTYFEEMQKRVNKFSVNNNFYFMTGQKELWPILKEADLVIRATNTDGDSLSVREALYFNVTVVASDVVIRPEGCILFKNRDLMDLYDRCKNILKSI